MKKGIKNKVENLSFKITALVSLAIFLFILVLIKLDIIIPLDNWINSFISISHNQILDNIMFAVVEATNMVNAAIFIIIILFALIISKRWTEFFVLILGSFSAFFLEFLAKIIIHRARPENALLSLSDYSFPSGHSALSALIFVLIFYIFRNDIKNKALKSILTAFCIISPLLIGFSRIYAQVHWLSDVLGGFALGLFCFALFASYLHEPAN